METPCRALPTQAGGIIFQGSFPRCVWEHKGVYIFCGDKGRGRLWFLCCPCGWRVMSHQSASSLFLVAMCQHLEQLRGRCVDSVTAWGWPSPVPAWNSHFCLSLTPQIPWDLGCESPAVSSFCATASYLLPTPMTSVNLKIPCKPCRPWQWGGTT